MAKVIVSVNARTNAVVGFVGKNAICLNNTNAAVKWGKVVVAVSATHGSRTDYHYKRISIPT